MADIGRQLKSCIVVTAALFILILPPLRVHAAGECLNAVPQTGPYEPDVLRRTGFEIPGRGCSLFIDLDICTMIVYMDGRLSRAYPVSGGSNATPSPVGTWHVTDIDSWGEGFGGTWIGLNVPWGIYGIHGTFEPWMIGEYNASHGCIRMLNKDAAELKKLVSVGDVVFIKYDSSPFRALSHGMTGSDVMEAQKMLKKLGYFYGWADGIFGDATELAVRQYQWKNGLKEDGVVGRRTFDKLRAMSEG